MKQIRQRIGLCMQQIGQSIAVSVDVCGRDNKIEVSKSIKIADAVFCR